jgi:hypothetical protein
MLKRVLTATLVVIAASTGFVLEPAHAAPDHLSCYHVRDPLHRNTFSTVLLGESGTQTCVVKVPAKLACVQVDETNTIRRRRGERRRALRQVRSSAIS